MEKALYHDMVASVGGTDNIRLIITASACQYYLYSKNKKGTGRYVIIEEAEDWMRMVDVARGTVTILSYEEIELIVADATPEEEQYAKDIVYAVENGLPIPPSPFVNP